MSKVVTQEDLFSILATYEARIARLETAVYLLGQAAPGARAAEAPEPAEDATP